MSAIAKQVQRIYELINQAETRYHRKPGSVKLLAVSKGQSIVAIKEAIKAGQHAFAKIICKKRC